MSQNKTVLITDKFAQESLLTLQSQNYLQLRRSANPSLDSEDLSEVHALLIRSRTPITNEVLARAKKLQVIITCTSGFDHIDLKACEKWGITVMFTPEANIESAAQLTWSLVLACASHLINAHKAVKAGEWLRELVVGQELFGKTYGIVGLGRIGSRVAEIANVFGMKVIAYDPYLDDQDFRSSEAERVAFEEILKRSDVLSFHVPKTAETRHMLNRSHFEYTHRGLILVNTSRGSVIHEEDLVEALRTGSVSSAGLDVYEKEPLSRQSNLLSLPNVILTPHVGANTNEAFHKASDDAALKIIRFFVEGSTSDTLPPKAAWYGAQPAFS
jgi:D-3-phosphoglycerate dehydrogenase